MLIDGEDIEELDGFEDALVVFEELRKSTESSGKYLIFTCACGVAEDGGWEGVDVSIDGDNVKWEFEVGDKFYRYIFDKNEYLAEVQSIITPIEKTDLQIEPRSVIYPENFVRQVVPDSVGFGMGKDPVRFGDLVDSASQNEYGRKLLENIASTSNRKLSDYVDNVRVVDGDSQFYLSMDGRLTIDLSKDTLLKGEDWAFRAGSHEFGHALKFDKIKNSKFNGKNGAAWDYTTAKSRRFGSNYYSWEEAVVDRYARMRVRNSGTSVSNDLLKHMVDYEKYWRAKYRSTK